MPGLVSDGAHAPSGEIHPTVTRQISATGVSGQIDRPNPTPSRTSFVHDPFRWTTSVSDNRFREHCVGSPRALAAGEPITMQTNAAESPYIIRLAKR
jgi:hypothetical protein